jgi:hypothetical protein
MADLIKVAVKVKSEGYGYGLGYRSHDGGRFCTAEVPRAAWSPREGRGIDPTHPPHVGGQSDLG